MKTRTWIMAALLGGWGSGWAAPGGPEVVWSTNDHFTTVRAIGFSRDSLRLASAGEGYTLKVWDVTAVNVLRTIGLPQEHPLCVALSSDGSHLAAGTDEGQTRVWRVSDGVRLWTGGVANDLVHAVAFSPDDLLLGIGRQDTLLVAQSLTPQGIFMVESGSPVRGVCFTPDGAKVAGAQGEGSARLWQVPSGALERTFSGHSNAVSGVDISPDGRWLATVSLDGTARLWNLTNGAVRRILDGAGGTAVKFNSDGRLLATVSGGGVHFWRTDTGQRLHSYPNLEATCLDVARDGRHFAYGTVGGTVVLARMPLWFERITRSGRLVTLSWQGGSGRYQIQARADAVSGLWQDLGGPTTNTVFTHTCLSPIFYRVQSLPPAP